MGVDNTILKAWTSALGSNNMLDYLHDQNALKCGMRAIILKLCEEGKLKFCVPPAVIERLVQRVQTTSTSNAALEKQQTAYTILKFLKNNSQFFEIIHIPENKKAEFVSSAQELASKYDLWQSVLKDAKTNHRAIVVAQNALLGLSTLTNANQLLTILENSEVNQTHAHNIAGVNKLFLGRGNTASSVLRLENALSKHFNIYPYVPKQIHAIEKQPGVMGIGLDTNVLFDWGRIIGPQKFEDYIKEKQNNEPSHYTSNASATEIINMILQGKLVFYIPPTVMNEVRKFAELETEDTELLKSKIIALFSLAMIDENPQIFKKLSVPRKFMKPFLYRSNQLAAVYCADNPNKMLRTIPNPKIQELLQQNPLSCNIMTTYGKHPCNDARIVAQNALFGLDTLSFDAHLTGRLNSENDDITKTSIPRQIAQINQLALGEPYSTFSNLKTFLFIKKKQALQKEDLFEPKA